MKMLFICLSVSTEKNSQYHLSQYQNSKSEFIGQSLDTCGHSPPRSPHMEQYPVHSCRVPPSVGHDTSIGFQLEIRDNLILYGCQNKNNITYEQMKDDITYTNKYKNKHKILHEKIDKSMNIEMLSN